MRRRGTRNNFNNFIIQHLNNNAKMYIIVTIIFFLGIIFGIIFVNNTNKDQQMQINTYINNFIDSVKEQKQISKIELLKESVKNNLYIVLILWFLGSTVIGMPLIYLVVMYKGYSIGYTISSIIAVLGIGKGIIFLLITMLLPYIIYIPCILSLAVSGINLYKLVVEDRRRENIKIQIVKHTIFCLIIFVFMIIASILQVYISTSLLPMLK